MKRLVPLLIFLFPALAFPALAQGFVNLDFEQASQFLTTLPPGQAGGYVPISSGAPGWVGFTGNTPVTLVLQNDLTLGAASIDILGPHFFPVYIIDGNYSVMLQAGGYGSGDVNTSIAQTGAIPIDAQSLQFKASAAPSGASFSVTFAGNALSPVLLSSGPNFNEYGVNIAPFAGQTGQLEFTSVFDSTFSRLLLDDISFSTTAVPEPNSLILTSVSGLLFAAHRRHRLRSVRVSRFQF